MFPGLEEEVIFFQISAGDPLVVNIYVFLMNYLKNKSCYLVGKSQLLLFGMKIIHLLKADILNIQKVAFSCIPFSI